LRDRPAPGARARRGGARTRPRERRAGGRRVRGATRRAARPGHAGTLRRAARRPPGAAARDRPSPAGVVGVAGERRPRRRLRHTRPRPSRPRPTPVDDAHARPREPLGPPDARERRRPDRAHPTAPALARLHRLQPDPLEAAPRTTPRAPALPPGPALRAPPPAPPRAGRRLCAALDRRARWRRGERPRHRARRVGQHAGARGGRQPVRPRASAPRRAGRRAAIGRAGDDRRGRGSTAGGATLDHRPRPDHRAARRAGTAGYADRPGTRRRAGARRGPPAARRPGAGVGVLTGLPPSAGGLARARLAGVDWIAIGRRDDNLAITDLAVDAPPFADPADVHVEVEVRNFGSASRATTLEATLD